jgi:multiple sugar transport system substrate-binding protein
VGCADPEHTTQTKESPVIRSKAPVAVGALSAIALALTACSGGGEPSDGPVELTYALWDTSQKPAYEECAADFAQKTGIAVTVRQTDWSGYWTTLSTDFVAGTGPDVFANVTRNYPDFVRQGQIVDLTPLIERDQVNLDQYIPVTLRSWTMEGKYWGLPKDIDAIGLAYDENAVQQGGIDQASLGTLTWNPVDGGTFGETIKALTLDSAGRNGLDPAFDKASVQRYGLEAVEVESADGHSSWGNFAAASGTELLTPNPFGQEWHYGDPAVVDAVAWYQKMTQDGYIQPGSLNSSLSTASLFESGKIAMTADGNWNAGLYAESGADIAWARIPAGPNGVKSYSNSLADSINAATEHPDEAWEWVKYLGSPECQDTVASHGVVFPAIAASTEKALAAYAEKGVDLGPVLDTINDPGAVVALPIGLNFGEVSELANAAIQDIFLNGADPTQTLTRLETEVNALYR